ncbi:MAG: nucleotidyltransferase domain-containing protein, partial [Rhodocyclaceae bacterium]|nr:nucleotidyltransferase domain-containing protein [Rhodocyclaceae bacterium]
MTHQRANTALVEIREILKQGQKDLAAAYLARPDHRAYLAGRSQLVDQVLERLWLHEQLPNGAALIAVGGYGRNELYPHSDIDVLIALESPATPKQETVLARLVSQFWDIGLAVGHSVRTIDECISAAESDVTVQTALSESRLICGQQTLYQQLQQAIDICMDHGQFIAAKLAEQE